jgi:cellulose biosynthesis protein BcsQ
MTFIVTLYNHKGGVSKTTTTFNLAHLLAEKQKKVLVVDADPQCNMTELLLAPQIACLDREAEEKGQENKIPGTSLLEIMKPRIESDVPEIDIDRVETVRINNYLDCIPGSIDLNILEDPLAEAFNQRFNPTKTHEKRNYVALGDFLTRFGQKNHYDYVFLDVGPSSGALTRTCFLSCDALFIPVAPDRFNVQAIRSLSSIIERWMHDHAQIFDDFVKLKMPIKCGRPAFLGTITQQFKVTGGRPKPGYQLWMDRIPESVEKFLLPVFKKYSWKGHDLTSGLTKDHVSVTEIPDFGSFAPLMQEYGKAVFQIERKDTATIVESGVAWSGGTWMDAQRRMEHLKTKYETIYSRLENARSCA